MEEKFTGDEVVRQPKNQRVVNRLKMIIQTGHSLKKVSLTQMHLGQYLYPHLSL